MPSAHSFQDLINNILSLLFFLFLFIQFQYPVNKYNNINKYLEDLNELREEKIETLVAAMPLNISYKEIRKPSKLVKADGSMSVKGIKWFDMLDERNLPRNYSSPIMKKDSEESGNPASSTQLKDWLFLRSESEPSAVMNFSIDGSLSLGLSAPPA